MTRSSRGPTTTLGSLGTEPYAMVPENYTEIDRLKIGVTLPEHATAMRDFIRAER